MNNQRGATPAGLLISFSLSLIILTLVLNSLSDQYLVKNIIKEDERDLEYNLKSLSRSLVNTSDISQNTDLNVTNYIEVVSEEYPNSFFFFNIHKDGLIDTKGMKLTLLNSKAYSNVSLRLSLSDADNLNSVNQGKLFSSSYAFQANQISDFQLDGNLNNKINIVEETGGLLKQGLNIRFLGDTPKDLKGENLQLKLPTNKEGGNVISGNYYVQ